MLARLATYAPTAARVAVGGWLAMLAAFLLLAADSGGSWERIYRREIKTPNAPPQRPHWPKYVH